MEYFDKISAGEIITRITNDTNEIKQGIIDLSYALYCFVIALGGISLLLLISFKLSLVMVGLTPLVAVGLMVQSHYLAKYSKQKIRSIGKAGKVADEIINNIKIISTHSTHSFESFRYLKAIYRSYQIAKKSAYVEGITHGLIELIFSIAVVVAIGAAGYMVIKGMISIGEVVLYLMCVVEVMDKFGSLPQYIASASKSFASSSFIFRLLLRSPKIKNEGKERIEEVEGRIEMRGVKFSYPSRDLSILPLLSFTALPRQITSLVGQSGSGKSTVLSILMRFYEFQSGTVLLDNRDIRNLDLTWLRSQMAIVLQDSMLFSDTIFNNICYGDVTPLTPIKIKRIIAAARLANAHSFISLLPQSYNTVINKSTLSGGQRQRIAIARAVYRDPKIIFLDEFTSSLDSENQKQVVEAVLKLMRNRTVILISHNFTVTHQSDHIYVMAKGEIVEEGNHESLIEQGGVYSMLSKMQSL